MLVLVQVAQAVDFLGVGLDGFVVELLDDGVHGCPRVVGDDRSESKSCAVSLVVPNAA